MYCVKCGSKLKEGALFCTKCGHKIKYLEAPVVAESQEPDSLVEEGIQVIEEPVQEEVRELEEVVEEVQITEEPVQEGVREPEEVVEEVQIIEESVQEEVREPEEVVEEVQITEEPVQEEIQELEEVIEENIQIYDNLVQEKNQISYEQQMQMNTGYDLSQTSTEKVKDTDVMSVIMTLLSLFVPIFGIVFGFLNLFKKKIRIGLAYLLCGIIISVMYSEGIVYYCSYISSNKEDEAIVLQENTTDDEAIVGYDNRTTTDNVVTHANVLFGEPFWGVWVRAEKDYDKANELKKNLESAGIVAFVVVTSDWTNLNPETYYAVTLGMYSTKEEAQAVLPIAQKAFGNAYVKYSGVRK